nr:ABC transporter permease [Eremococcus coleocola]
MVNKKQLNKEIFRSLKGSLGRFFSILFLMALGAFALVGLKVSGPDIDHSASSYYDKYHTFDLAVMSDYGLDQSDQDKLNQLKDQAKVEFAYFADVVIKDTPKSMRVFSNTKDISQFELVQGDFPSASDEIALGSSWQDQYKLGDQIELEENQSGLNLDLSIDQDEYEADKESEAKDQVLKKHRFTITGFVNSSEIISTGAMGSSNSGSGTLAGYAVVTPETFDMDVYTIARIAYNDLRDLEAYSDDYTDRLAQHQTDLDKLIEGSGQARLADIKADAQEKIDDGQADIDQAKEDIKEAEQKLKDGQKEINNNQKKLDDGQKEIADKDQEIQSASQKLEDGRSQLAASKSQLDAAADQINQGYAQLEPEKAKLDEVAAQLAGPQAQLDQAKADLDSSMSQLDQAQAQIDEGQAQLDALASQLQEQGIDPATSPDYQAGQTNLDSQKQTLAAGQAQYEAGLAQYQEQKALFGQESAPYQEGLAQYQAAKAKLDASLAEYNSGLAKYNQGLADFQSQEAKFKEGQAKLQAAKDELATNQKKLDDAKDELAENKATFADEKAKANKDIKNAEDDLAQARDNIEDLAEPAYTSYTRRTLPGSDGYVKVYTASHGISQVGNLFPVVLYLVAALVTVTTMTRFVTEERTNAGVLKALGYQNKDVYKKFTVYGFTAGMLGTLIGVFAGMYLLPYLLDKTLMADTTLPALSMPFHWTITLFALVCTILVSVLPPLYIAHKELKETASQLLLPKPPSKGSKILLEKIPFIWNRLSFTHKVTARNLFRYKQRGLMTIFGVAGSVALLFSGLGMQSSLSTMGQRQFGDIIKYDAIVALQDDINESDQADLDQALASDTIKQKEAIYTENFSKEIKEVEDKQSITLMAIDNDSFAPYIHLANRKDATDTALKVTDDGAIINEKLAKLMKLKVGDKFTIEDNLNNSYEIKIAGISEMYAGHFIYMNKGYYEKVFGKDFAQNAYLMTFNDSSADNVQEETADFMRLDAVKAVVQNTSAISLVNSIVNSLNTVMNVLTIAASLLAIVILYNLTNINVSERIRELSTIKVLGFLNQEVTLYIYRETIVLSLIGIAVGMLGGKVLHRIILETVAPDNMMFSQHVSTFIHLFPVVLIILILIALAFMVNHILKRVDMLEALKSVD